MLYQLNATEWRILRRLHLVGGTATWTEIRPHAQKVKEAELQAMLLFLDLTVNVGDKWKLTARGREVQELGEVILSMAELRGFQI